MTIEEKKLEGYITLKEASELFGYSPDYIGQLIRKGKIEGKQVYANVAWMTTKDALDEYLAREKNGSTKQSDSTLLARATRMLLHEQSVFLATWALRILIPVLVVTLIVIFYFISISIDHQLVRAAERRLSAQTHIQTVDRAEQPVSENNYFSYEK